MARAVKKIESPAAAVAVIAESELQQILNDRKSVADLKATIRATEKRLDAQEKGIIQKLRGGAKVEGSLVCIVNVVKGRVAVSWKDVAQRLAVKAGLLFEAVELEERNAKEAALVPEPELVITGNAVEQYKAQ